MCAAWLGWVLTLAVRGVEPGGPISGDLPSPANLRPQSSLGGLLGHLTGPGQLLGKHESQSRWGVQQDIKDSGFALLPTSRVRLGSHGTAERLGALCGKGVRTRRPERLRCV